MFGASAVDHTVGRVQAHLDPLGYAAQLRRPNLQRALCELMLAARSPLLDDLADQPELLVALRAREHTTPEGRDRATRLHLVDVKVLTTQPFGAAPTREEWLAAQPRGARLMFPSSGWKLRTGGS